MFEVETDHRRRLLKVTMTGFWTAETMASYYSAARKEFEALERTAGSKYVLINMAAYSVQSPKIAEEHAAYLRVFLEQGRARVAVVMPSALARMQAARVSSNLDYGIFKDEHEAMDWLFSQTDSRPD